MISKSLPVNPGDIPCMRIVPSIAKITQKQLTDKLITQVFRKRQTLS